MFLASCCLLPLAENRHAEFSLDRKNIRNAPIKVDDTPFSSDNGVIEEVEDQIDGVIEEVEDQIDGVMNFTQNKLFLALSNLSMYLPISVDYAVTVGKNCDIITNNKRFYAKIPLLMSAVLILLGILFGFFGESM